MEQTFHLVGEIDLASVDDLEQRMRAAILAGDGDFVVDASELQFIDATGLRVLVGAQDTLAGRGRRMQMVGVPPIARRAIEVLGLLEVLGVDGDGRGGGGGAAASDGADRPSASPGARRVGR